MLERLLNQKFTQGMRSYKSYVLVNELKWEEIIEHLSRAQLRRSGIE